MNSVILIGRLTRDPDVRYSASQLAVARFTIAIDRIGRTRDGGERGTDFPSIVCFGRTAELCEPYITKGRLVAVQGRIQTGSYEKDGRTIYTTDVIADRVQFLDRAGSERRDSDEDEYIREPVRGKAPEAEIPSGFSALTDDDIPF